MVRHAAAALDSKSRGKTLECAMAKVGVAGVLQGWWLHGLLAVLFASHAFRHMCSGQGHQ